MNSNVLLKFAEGLSEDTDAIDQMLSTVSAPKVKELAKHLGTDIVRFCHENFDEFGRLTTSELDISKETGKLSAFILPMCWAAFQKWFKLPEATRDAYAYQSRGIDFNELVRRDIMRAINGAEWLYNKQVFEFSDELLLSLTSDISTFDVNLEKIVKNIKESMNDEDISSNLPTENLMQCLSIKLFVDRINFLPFRTFVLDVSGNKMFKGSGISALQITPLYYPENYRAIIHAEVIQEDGTIKGCYAYNLSYKNNLDLLREDNGAKYVSVALFYSKEADDLLSGKSSGIKFEITGGINDDAYNSVIGAVACQVINYLGSDDADVEESEATKKTYRPTGTSKIRNTFKEIQKWDCGFHYANSIRQYRKAYESAHVEGTGTPKRPHVRKAHWHHYWVGSEENRRLIRKWLPAISVKMDFHSDLNLTIRREK